MLAPVPSTKISVLGVGYASFYSFTESVSGPSSSAQMNASMGVGDSIFGIGGVIFVIILVMSIVGLVYYRVSTPQRYKKFSKIIDFFNTTTYYFGWGLLSFVVIVVPGYLMWLLF